MHPHWAKPFLTALAATGIVARAARAAGIESGAAYKLRQSDADFAAAWDEALEDAADTLEAEARRRAVEGVAEPVVYQGQLTPVWETDERGQPLLESYYTPDGKPAQRPVQKVDANGRPVWLTITRYSDPLLALLLKGRRKKVFAERTELTGADGGPMETRDMDRTARAARIAALMAVAGKRKSDQDDFGDLA